MAKQSTSKTKTPNVQPLADRVLVRPADAGESEKTSAAGIILPETADDDKTQQGDVVAVGPGKRDEDGKYIEPSVAVGDRVIFSKYGYDEISVDGSEYYIVSEANVLAKIT